VPERTRSRGVQASVLASVLFGVTYYYTSFLAPLTSTEITAWRVVLSFLFMTVLLVSLGQWPVIRQTLGRLKRRPSLLLGFLLSAALLAVQLWLFMWAPLNERALEVSLGYFLLPLSMVIVGRFLYGERLSRLQLVATAFAVIGVAHEVFRFGGFPWESLLVALGYPLYFVLRRTLKISHLGGLWVEFALLLPVAILLLAAGPSRLGVFVEQPSLIWLVLGLGLISAAALIGYILASRNLDLSLFGLLGYLEPSLLLVVALLLGEMIGSEQWFTYLPIWLAVLVLTVDGLRGRLRRR
jgi:chloramphenicol-sensitive protein RarD